MGISWKTGRHEARSPDHKCSLPKTDRRRKPSIELQAEFCITVVWNARKMLWQLYDGGQDCHSKPFDLFPKLVDNF